MQSKDYIEFTLRLAKPKPDSLLERACGRVPCRADSVEGSTSPQTSLPPNVQQLVIRAVQEFEDYQRLTSEGKLGEAGKKLEEHKRTLEELRKTSKKQP